MVPISIHILIRVSFLIKTRTKSLRNFQFKNVVSKLSRFEKLSFSNNNRKAKLHISLTQSDFVMPKRSAGARIVYHQL